MDDSSPLGKMVSEQSRSWGKQVRKLRWSKLLQTGVSAVLGTDDVNLFSRTRQLNVTCDSSVDREFFLHYSLIPSVSKGVGTQGRSRSHRQ